MIPLAAILTRFAEGLSVREVARQYSRAVPLVQALWEAEVLGVRDPREVLICAACSGSGARDGVPCERCRGSGMAP